MQRKLKWPKASISNEVCIIVAESETDCLDSKTKLE